ncbi:UNVERIFIED_ORG: hypothetical protein [Escherichia phage CMSTMSU]
MMDILNSLPFVQDANSDVVTFTGNDSESTGEVEQNSEDQVEDWQQKLLLQQISNKTETNKNTML